MAEEPEEDQVEEAPKPSPTPGRYLMLIILILVFEGVGGYILLDRLIPAPEEIPPEEVEEVKETRVEKPRYYTGLKEMIVNPFSERGSRLVQLSLALEVSTSAVIDELDIKKDRVWDLVIQRIEAHSIKEIRSSGKKLLKADLIKALNAELRNGDVTAIYVTDIVVQ